MYSIKSPLSLTEMSTASVGVSNRRKINLNFDFKCVWLVAFHNIELLLLIISNSFPVTLFFFSQLDISWTGRGKLNICYYSTIMLPSSMNFVIFHFINIKATLFNTQICSWIYKHKVLYPRYLKILHQKCLYKEIYQNSKT